MTVGTKSLLFGVHQFLLHPIFVCLAWKRLYNKWPSIAELFCILIHDVGYWGKADMDGMHGTFHPLAGGRIADAILGKRYGDLVRYHSRTLASHDNTHVSKLCAPDKLALLLYPEWLYIFLGRLSGETEYYKYTMGMADCTDSVWLQKT